LSSKATTIWVAASVGAAGMTDPGSAARLAK
jgi:hypothetical protein